MTIVDGAADDKTLQIWAVINELSEQLNTNRRLSVALSSQAGAFKTQAVHARTGFVLRRFNTDMPKEQYDAELEAMAAALAADNSALAHDNKQLNTLIKEHEHTLDTLMAGFRTRARDVQARELALIREYERRLLAHEDAHGGAALAGSAARGEGLARLAALLRAVVRAQGGEDEGEDEGEAGAGGDDAGGREPWRAGADAAHALERETELARLQAENAALRVLAGIAPEEGPAGGGGGAREAGGGAEVARVGPGRAVPEGPYGTFKGRS